MKIHHIVSSIDISTGGPARSVTNLISSILCRNNDFFVNLSTINSLNPIIEDFESEQGKIIFCSKNYFGYSKELNESLVNAKLLHGHGLWEIPVHQMAKYAQKNKIPYIITPRGMLEPWSLSQNSFKKEIALIAFQNKDIVESNCIHVTGNIEALNIRKLGYKNPIAIIPNGIELEKYPVKTLVKKTNKKILFLSRIHKKKGIENLINAWNGLGRELTKNWTIEIVGNGEEDYISNLNKLIKSKKLESDIVILKPKFGIDKVNAYKNADLFILPTYSENFGIVVAEALSCGVPVITTKGTPWEDLELYNAGSWIDIGVLPLQIEMEKYLKMSTLGLYKKGQNGRVLIEEKYSIESVADKMVELYLWILDNDCETPDFIDTL